MDSATQIQLLTISSAANDSFKGTGCCWGPLLMFKLKPVLIPWLYAKWTYPTHGNFGVFMWLEADKSSPLMNPFDRGQLYWPKVWPGVWCRLEVCTHQLPVPLWRQEAVSLKKGETGRSLLTRKDSLKKEDILTSAVTWANLGDTVLSDGQTLWLHSLEGPEESDSKTENTAVVASCVPSPKSYVEAGPPGPQM